MTWLDLILDLLTLYHNYGDELDPEEEQFRSFERRLLRMKDEAYGERNLLAMERYHIVLGQVYFDREATDGPREVYTAQYHLRRAVEVARLRAGRTEGREYQPLPHLSDRLAQVYVEIGEVDAAVQAATGAVMGYLDQGRLAGAEAALTRAMGFTEQEQAGELAQLNGLLKTYRDVGGLADASEEVRQAAYADALADEGGIFGVKVSDDLDPVFRERQRVLMLNRLGQQAAAAGDWEQAWQLQVHTVDVLRDAKQPPQLRPDEVLFLPGAMDLLPDVPGQRKPDGPRFDVDVIDAKTLDRVRERMREKGAAGVQGGH